MVLSKKKNYKWYEMVKRIFDEISDDTFEIYKKQLNQYLNFYYVLPEKVTKECLAEKVFDYMDVFKEKNNLKSKDIIYTYIHTLLPLLENRIEMDSRAGIYYKKLLTLVSEIEKGETEDIYNSILDFTRVFICLFQKTLVSHELVKTINFSLTNFDYSKFIQSIEQEKLLKKIVIKVKVKVKVEKSIPDSTYELKNRYSKINMSLLLMTIFYIGILNNQPESEVK